MGGRADHEGDRRTGRCRGDKAPATFLCTACFLATAPVLGFVGVLVTLEKLLVAPTASFSITDWTIYIIFIAVIGGIGSLEGPIVGPIVFFILREYLASFGT